MGAVVAGTVGFGDEDGFSKGFVVGRGDKINAGLSGGGVVDIDDFGVKSGVCVLAILVISSWFIAVNTDDDTGIAISTNGVGVLLSAAGEGVGIMVAMAGEGVGVTVAMAGEGVGVTVAMAGEGVGVTVAMAGEGVGVMITVTGDGVGNIIVGIGEEVIVFDISGEGVGDCEVHGDIFPGIT